MSVIVALRLADVPEDAWRTCERCSETVAVLCGEVETMKVFCRACMAVVIHENAARLLAPPKEPR